MICLICRQAETIEGLTSILFERDKINLVVSSVPARVCPGCGDAYIIEAVAVQLLQVTNKVFQVGIFEDTIEYEKLLQK